MVLPPSTLRGSSSSRKKSSLFQSTKILSIIITILLVYLWKLNSSHILLSSELKSNEALSKSNLHHTEEKVRSLEKQNHQLKTELSEVNESYRKLKTDEAVVKSKLDEHEKEVKTIKATNQELNDELEELKESLSSLQEKDQDATSQIHGMEETIETLTSQNEGLKKAIPKLELKSSETQMNSNITVATMVEMEEQLADLEWKNDELRKEKDNLEEALTEMHLAQGGNVAIIAKVNSLESYNEKLRQEVSQLQREAGANATAAEDARPDFLSIARRAGTDKVAAVKNFESCLQNGSHCIQPNATNVYCRPSGHFYHTIYQTWLGPLSRDDVEPFQFLEIGFSRGAGFDAFSEFLPKAEVHGIERSCELVAVKHKQYFELLDQKRLHCGDAGDLKVLQDIWKTMKQKDKTPPLRVVVDDGSHDVVNVLQTFFYWFPKIEPGGLLIVEDILPKDVSNPLRTHFLPQIMSDLHYCGDATSSLDTACLPTLQPLLKGIHCEMHICVFERNEVPADVTDDDVEKLKIPVTALNASRCDALLHGYKP